LPITIDHQVIFSWAQRRGAHPSTLDGDERPWPLFFKFDAVVSEHKEISWDRFFVEFEQANLAFVYQDVSPDGGLDISHEFVKRPAVIGLLISSKA
jgi:hypothetical protein